ncbi:MAG: helix-turn-helix transcriptional regulator [Oscillospiraceae bacterium]|nr:helix-turn-helix transcriptional regulator [Oscillospiraceae bacterium]
MEPVCNNDREGQIIRDRRIELGLTLEQAAIEIGMSLQQYQRYEYGERRFSNCPMRIGLRICAVLELDPFEVVGAE